MDNTNFSSNKPKLPLDWLITPDLAFDHPDQVVDHPDLDDSERRAILASWASDIRAVEGCPTLRRLTNGAVVSVAEIMAALQRLDRRRQISEVGALQ